MTDSARPVSPTPPDHLPLTRRELVLVVAFWAVYALLTVAGRVFDSGPGPRLDWTSAPVVVAVVESLCWALLTPVIFGLAGRFGSERGGPGAQVALFVAVGIAVARS